MVGAQHQRPPDQIGTGRIQLPGPGALQVQGGCGGAATQQAGCQAAHQQAGAGQSACRRQLPLRADVVGTGQGEQGQQCLFGAAFTPLCRQCIKSRGQAGRCLGEGLFHGAVPKQGGGLFDTGLSTEPHRILAAIVQAPVFDQRQRRLQHRQAPVQRRPRHFARPAATGAVDRQAFHFGGQVTAFPRFFPRMGVQQATADVGIQGLARHAQQGGGIGGRKIGAHGGSEWVDKLIKLINIDD